MVTFLKGTLAGALLAFIVAGIIGRLGSTGGLLYVRHFEIDGVRFFWSWALFVIGAGLGWVIFALLE
jgi:hypothetical protein